MSETNKLISLKERFDLYGLLLEQMASPDISEKAILLLKVISFEKGMEHWRNITLEEFVAQKVRYYDLVEQELLSLVIEFAQLTSEQDDCTVTDEMMSVVADVLAECGKILPYIRDENTAGVLIEAAIVWMKLCSSPLAAVSSDVVIRLLGALQLANLCPMTIKPVIIEPQNEAANNIFWPGNTDPSLVN